MPHRNPAEINVVRVPTVGKKQEVGDMNEIALLSNGLVY